MTTNLQIKEAHVAETGFQEQTLSLLIPFEQKVNTKAKIEGRIHRLVEQAEKQLMEHLPKQQVKLILSHLQRVIESLDYGTHKKSVALMATPTMGRAYYWNIPVQETILISKEFPVRQLLARKKVEKEYLLLAMGDHFAGIYLGNGTKLTRLVANSPAFAAYTSNESAGNNLKYTSGVHRSVRHIDDALTILLRSYQCPVFVFAPAENLEGFKQLSRNNNHIVALEEAAPDGSEKGLQQLMASYLSNWQSLKEKALVQQLELALQSGKLAVGISEVWKAAAEKRGRLLVVEEDYIFPAYLDHKDGILYSDAIPISPTARQVSDAVADAIEKVLADGGIVEVVRKGALTDFVHSAMVCY